MIRDFLKKHFVGIEPGESDLNVGRTGNRYWYDAQGRLHRQGEPAYEAVSGTREWWFHGRRHRLDGPAVERITGPNEWWIDGKRLTEEEFGHHPEAGALQRQRLAAEKEARLKEMHRVLGAAVREFHKNIRRPG